ASQPCRPLHPEAFQNCLRQRRMQLRDRERTVPALLRLSFGQLIVVLALLNVHSLAYAQDLTGKWVLSGTKLDNGETLITLLELKQSGSKLTGNIKSPGYIFDVIGDV